MVRRLRRDKPTKGAAVPERDGYIPGVPCWVDTSQPDPDAAAEFFMARIRGGDVAAVGSIPEGAPQMATWNTYVQVDSADDAATKVREAGGKTLMEPFDVMDAGRMAVFA